MAEERSESREIPYRPSFLFVHIFRAFRIALNPKNLVLAAAGILVMSFGWWLLAAIFSGVRKEPVWPTDYPTADYSEPTSEAASAEDKAWEAFKRDRNSWSLLYEAAGRVPKKLDASDLAQSPAEFELLHKEIGEGKTHFELGGKTYVLKDRPYGRLCTWPWSEDRGPNPYLLVTGKAGAELGEGATHHGTWQRGEFLDWFIGYQMPVLIEPLVKFLRPVFYFLHPNAGLRERIYFLLVILWTVATWAIFGGAIMRLAAVDFARNESIPLSAALKFALKRWKTYVLASAGPLVVLGIAFFVLAVLVGLINLIPLVGDLWASVLWLFVVIPVGIGIAVVMLGLVCWPMIHVTLSVEGSDAFDAVGRSYNYVISEAWHYIWYVLVAIVYGAAVVFFVGLVGSLAVYMGKWGVASMPGSTRFKRDPSYYCVYAPTSFGWRDLLLQGSPVVGSRENFTQADIDAYVSKTFHVWNYVGAAFVSLWLLLFFLMVVGFGYSYFWSVSTIIYFLMRRRVDDVDLDEIYLEDESEPPQGGLPVLEPAPAPPASAARSVQMVEAPAILKSGPLSSSGGPSSTEENKPNPGDAAFKRSSSFQNSMA